MDRRGRAALVEAMSADQQADFFRELRRTDTQRLLDGLDAGNARLADALLRYPPESAGGIMTTEFVTVPSTWTVEQTLEHIRDVGRREGNGLRHLRPRRRADAGATSFRCAS